VQGDYIQPSIQSIDLREKLTAFRSHELLSAVYELSDEAIEGIRDRRH
jgi:hypothetical protein